MSLLDRLFGKKEPQRQPFDANQYVLDFAQFIGANTRDESQRVVECTPSLLDPQADDLLDLLAAAQPNLQARQVVEDHHALLRRCREVGIKQAFAEKIVAASGSGPDMPTELQFILQELDQPARPTDMTRRAQLCRQALTLLGQNENPRLWATLQVKLGNSLVQSLLGDRAENLEQAIAAYRQVLDVMTSGAMPAEWATVMTNLAAAYHSRVRGDRAENQEQAIAAYRQVLEVRTRAAMPVGWATTMMNLATAYHDRIRGDRAENLEQAIATYRQALEVMTRAAMPVEWATVMSNLATAYSDRIRGDRAENLEQAIAAYRQALEVRTRAAMPVEWAQVMMNLATAYKDRIRGDRAENLEQAIAAYRQALEVRTLQAMPVEWAQTMMNLANAYWSRIRGNRAENLEQAIAAHRQALEVLTRAAMPVEWAQVMMNLANAYKDRIRGDRAENLVQAIAAYCQALEVMTRQAMPVEWATIMMNLANAYYSRTPFLAEGDRVENFEQTIIAYRQVLNIFTPDGLPDDCRRAARNLATVCFTEGRYAQVVEPYRLAMQANEILLQVSLLRSSKEVELGEIQGLPANAAYALAKLGRLEEAVEALEAGRARLLAEALEGNRRDLERLAELGHGDLLARYRAVADRIAALQAQAVQPTASQSPHSPTYQSTIYQEIQAARGDLDATIVAIRQVSGYEDFFRPPTFEKIQQAATPEAPLIYLAVTSAGGLALVVQAPQTLRVSETRRVSVEALWLDDLTKSQVREAVYGSAGGPTLGGYRGAYAGWRRDSGNAAARDVWHAALDATTHWLWDNLMGDVVRALMAQGYQQAVLVPTGLLGLLPLHAAWTEDANRPTGRRYALDALALSYAPNAGALAAGHQTAARVRPDGVLAVDNPDGSLVFSVHEVEAVLSYFPAGHGKALRGNAAIRATVLDQLTHFPVYHLSTHGWAGWAEPLESGLLMAGGPPLTLADLLDLRLQNARLAVLSACETGIPGTKLPDEVIGLPAGLLQAGVAGVVASLWSVNDLSTAMLMERFYRLWREDGLAPAEALRQAQVWLRDSTNREKAEYFRRDVPALAGMRMPAAAAAELYVDYALRTDPNARVFAHPFWWAAFSLTGV